MAYDACLTQATRRHSRPAVVATMEIPSSSPVVTPLKPQKRRRVEHIELKTLVYGHPNDTLTKDDPAQVTSSASNSASNSASTSASNSASTPALTSNSTPTPIVASAPTSAPTSATSATSAPISASTPASANTPETSHTPQLGDSESQHWGQESDSTDNAKITQTPPTSSPAPKNPMRDQSTPAKVEDSQWWDHPTPLQTRHYLEPDITYGEITIDSSDSDIDSEIATDSDSARDPRTTQDFLENILTESVLESLPLPPHKRKQVLDIYR